MKHVRITCLFLIAAFVISVKAQTIGFNPDTVKAGKLDVGKMWTFEYPPVDYFSNTYNFKPSSDWFDGIRLSALRFGGGCSAGFVSEDGLIITNHHCVDGLLQTVQKEGENLPRDGFYAKTMADERKVPNLFVSRLDLIKDVTNEVVEAISKAKTNKEKVDFKNAKIQELQEKYNKETGLICNVTALYQGGKYTLYGYKRFNDVRVVIFMERIVGLYGGDPDNYTYPRYNSDFAVLRVYDETGKPLKTKNFFKLSLDGPQMNEPLFSLGYPGRTNRLRTVSQLKYNRDITYRNQNFQFEGLLKIYDQLMNEYPDKADLYRGAQFGPANMAKRVGGFVNTLSDPYLMARKEAFEKEFKKKIMEDPAKKQKYGHLWEGIDECRRQLRAKAGERAAFARQGNSTFFNNAYSLIEASFQMKLPEDKRDRLMQANNLENTLKNLVRSDIDVAFEKKTLAMIIDFLKMNLGNDHPLIKKYFSIGTSLETAEMLMKKSLILNKDKMISLLKSKPEDILTLDDPFIQYYVETRDLRLKYNTEANEIVETETALADQLGLALFEIYGTSIAPDATGTFRISDGKIATYPYNGTMAPPYTTFYGLYDRYYSQLKKWPWDLPERWVNYDKSLNLSAQNNFIATLDIVGGSSGSPIINKKGEYVGIIHDYNIEGSSLDFIFTEKTRALGLSSQGIFEIIKSIVKADRIVAEIKAGKLVN